MEITNHINDLFKNPGATNGGCYEIDLSLPDVEFNKVMKEISGKDTVLIGLFCVQDFENHPGFTLLYILENRNCHNLIALKRRLKTNQADSVAAIFPSACWFEREIRDGFGVEFPDAFDTRRLFLHEPYPDDFHPLLKNFRNNAIDTQFRIDPAREYRFKNLTGEGVYQIPVGPVHAGIIEPGHFRFSVIGETIFNLEIRMFYKHRGIEKLAEGKTADAGVTIAESISGDESVSNAVAFVMAFEKITGIEVPSRAWFIRTILLEMERIYAHLGDIAGMIVDVAFARGASPFFILREDILRQNDSLTGSRFMKGIIRPGGLVRDIANEKLERLSKYLDKFLIDFKSGTNLVRSTSSVVDRLETTGVIKQELISPLNITGPAARASGISIDTRIDHPYGMYPDMELIKRIAEKGDVLARFEVKSAEIIDSVFIVQQMIKHMPQGEINIPVQPGDGHAISLIESPRGQSLHWLNIKNGVIDRYKVRTASFCNWQVIELAILGNIVPDFPLINKSLNLSYAGTDL
jgi:formate hydrogenlyase subunit 5